MSAERVKNNKGGLTEALCVTGVGNEETSLYLWSVALTKPYGQKLVEIAEKKLIVEKSSYTIAEEANKKSTAVAQG